MGEEASKERKLIRAFGDLAVELQGTTEADATLRVIVEAAVRIIPGVHHAGISVVHGTEVNAVVPTSQVVGELDALQTRMDEGPSLGALREHRTVHIADMAADGRWPRFTAAALRLGVHSSLSFQLFIQRDNLGALNLYSGEADVFDEEATIVGEVLAQHASVAMAGSAVEAQFDRAVTSRDVIGQAKGILMHRANVGPAEAFHMLVEVSQTTNTKLIRVAELVVADHVDSLE